MCGFTGYLLTDRLETNQKIVQTMTALQQHRGPDDSGAAAIHFGGAYIQPFDFTDEMHMEVPAELMFGFNRLSILDLSANGHQPMLSHDGKVALMMNGEIYNAFEYTHRLQQLGYRFRGTSDTEVALYLYCEYGIEGMLSRLNGMFAFAIADVNQQKLFLVRDRFGIKPLYVLQQPGRLAFASEMKSFRALPDFRFEPDDTYLDEFLLFRNIINRTLFKNIENIPPGEYWEITPGGKITRKAYYQVAEEQGAMLPDEDAFLALDTTMEQCIRRQMISDVKLGCQLSGGVDSSLVAHYASRFVEKGALETISITFEDPRFSEAPYINQVAAKLDLRSHQYMMCGDYFFDIMDKVTWHFEQPLNHPSTTGIYLLSQKAKEHVTVLLSGEGADEALAGYPRFADTIRHPYLSRTFLSRLKHNSKCLPDFLRYYADPDARMVMSSAFGGIYNAALLKPDFVMEKALAHRLSVLKNIQDPDKINRHRKYELLTYLPDLLMRQDKMSMAHSIENRVPFLDNELISLAFRLPSQLLVQPHNSKQHGKKILKDICATVFDTDFAFRRKEGFCIPLKLFMKSRAFKERWESEWLPGIRNRGIFNPTYLQKIYANLPAATPMDLEALWLMVGFELWAKKYLN